MQTQTGWKNIVAHQLWKLAYNSKDFPPGVPNLPLVTETYEWVSSTLVVNQNTAEPQHQMCTTLQIGASPLASCKA
jgi:hypothetical protein